jgi:flagellar motor protein MotB
MAKSSCRCKKTECEECPEWIFTFADLVMLMMGFFVILWVLKPAPGKSDAAMDEKWLEVVAKIREAFKYLPDPTSKDPVDMYILMKKIEEMDPLKGKGDGGETKRVPRGALGTQPEVKSIREGKYAMVGTAIHFAAGKTDLSAESTRALDQVVGQILGHRQIFLIKGHTSQDDFDGAGDDQQKMDLSVRRAQVVIDYLVAHGVERKILRLEGCSSFEPVVLEAYTEDTRALNRRVEVEGTDSPVTERQDQAKTTKILPPGLATESAATPIEAQIHP